MCFTERHREMGQLGLWYIGGTMRGGKMQGDDIIFPNLDMCLITLAGWFNENLLKKNWNPRCNFIIFEPPCLNQHDTTAVHPLAYCTKITSYLTLRLLYFQAER